MKLHYPIIAAAVLLFAAFGPDPGIVAVPIFTVAIGFSLWNGIRLVREKRPATGLILIGASLILLGFSSMTWYVKHWTPWDDGDPHRHTLWELGHVH